MRKQHDHSDFILNLKINLKNYFFLACSILSFHRGLYGTLKIILNSFMKCTGKPQSVSAQYILN